MTLRPRTLVAKTLLLGSVLVGCSTDPTSPEFARTELSTALRRWRSASLTNYTFRGVIACYCIVDYTKPMRVTVRQGRVTEVVDIATGSARPTDFRPSVDSVFGLVLREIAERPERLQVTYDPTLGFPRTLTYGTPENDGGGYISIDSVVAIP